MEIEYKAGQVTAKQNGVIVATVTPVGGIDFGANIPDNAYWGGTATAGLVGDAVFG
jgi:hypothetical protein